MLGFRILYCKGMRPMMFQLSGFYCKPPPPPPSQAPSRAAIAWPDEFQLAVEAFEGTEILGCIFYYSI